MQWVYDENGVAIRPTFQGYLLSSRTVLSTAGTTTYTPPVGCRLLLVEAIGGGGNGGAAANSSAAQITVGAGGGGGAYSCGVVSPNMSPVGFTAVVAAGGTNTSSFATKRGMVDVTLISALGGAGGGNVSTGTSEIFLAGANGGGGISTGDEVFIGQQGGVAHRVSGTVALSGYGGAAPKYSANVNGVISNSVGTPGLLYGGGGSGGMSINAGGAKGGGAGSKGLLVIWEFY